MRETFVIYKLITSGELTTFSFVSTATTLDNAEDHLYDICQEQPTEFFTIIKEYKKL